MVESPFGYFLTDSMDGLQGLMLLDNGKIINKTAYICIGPKQNAQKDVLGIWVGKSESSSFWMSVLPDLKANGVVTCADNLNEFTDTIHVAPTHQSSTQICVVHQIRNTCKYIVYRARKSLR